MKIHLYNNASYKNKVDKTLNNEISKSGTLRQETSIVNPSIIMEGNIEDYALYNYMYIPKFKRYYFITNIKTLRNNMIEISGHTDVLMSFKDTILNETAIVGRQYNDYSMYLQDNYFKTYAYDIIITREFPNSFSGQLEYVLAVAGS